VSLKGTAISDGQLRWSFSLDATPQGFRHPSPTKLDSMTNGVNCHISSAVEPKMVSRYRPTSAGSPSGRWQRVRFLGLYSRGMVTRTAEWRDRTSAGRIFRPGGRRQSPLKVAKEGRAW
jgi:hypothetical protein